MSTGAERPVVFECHGEQLLGMLNHPAGVRGTGLLVVVGGPQYRVGSHRQFVSLSRDAARHGFPAMRFDCRGMGDSSGAARTFEAIDEDIRCAIDAFFFHCPGLRAVALWGLCDGASAALMYAHRDPRVRGLALLNPWVRSEQTLARAHLRHYYGARLLDAGFWRKLVAGELPVRESLLAFVGDMRVARAMPAAAGPPATYQHRMLEGLKKFSGALMLILSGKDLTAKEFEDTVAQDADWQAVLAQNHVVRHRLPEADHTFSHSISRCEVERMTLQWLHRVDGTQK